MKALAWLAGVFALGLFGWYIGGEEKKSAQEPADLAWIPVRSLGFVSLRPADLLKSDAGKSLLTKLSDKEKQVASDAVARMIGLAPADLERITAVVWKHDSETLLFVRSTEKLDTKAVLARLTPNATPKRRGGRPYFVADRMAVALLGDRDYVYGRLEEIERLLLEKPGQKPDGLAEALALVGKKHVVVVGANPRAYYTPGDTLEKELETHRALLSAQWAAASLVVTDSKWTMTLRAAFDDEDAAREGLTAVEWARKELRGGLAETLKQVKEDGRPGADTILELLGLADVGLKSATVERDGKTLKVEAAVKFDSTKLAAIGAKLAGPLRDIVERGQSVQNLKQIGIALHNYHDTNGAFPPHAIYDKNGKALLSWRVAILPYVDEEKLYKEFRLDEPWDSKHNKPLLARVPNVYRVRAESHKKTDTTFFLAFVGKGAAFEGKQGTRMISFSDGTSNTFLLAEGAKEVPWSKPEDHDFDEDKDLPKVGDVYPGGFHALFGDGSVRFIPQKTKQLKRYITREDGEVITDD